MTTHRDLCVIAAQWLLKQKWCDLVSWEMQLGRRKNGIADAIGVSSSPRAKTRRVSIIEVKRTRSDLLQDLRKKKLLKYEKSASHCYLAATPEAYRHSLKKDILADLKERGLPGHWGILIFKNGEVRVLRQARSIHTPRQQTINAIVRKIAKSFCYRVLGGSFTSKELNND